MTRPAGTGPTLARLPPARPGVLAALVVFILALAAVALPVAVVVLVARLIEATAR